MATRSAEWFEVEYNNRAREADFAGLMARWAQASALAREKAPCVLDVPYGHTARETLDVFSTDVAKAPVLVFIHGGYWRSLDKADHSFLASAFTDAGAMVVMPNYSLCPGVAMERIPLQLVQALAWVWRHASDHGGDPNRIALVGHSAGGHLAAMLNCCDWKAVAPDLPRDLVKGAMSISGVHDLAPLRHVAGVQADLKLDADSVRRLSPIHFPAPDTPMYAVVGGAESDEFRRQTRALRQAWGARAVPVCEELVGRGHFDILHDLADPQGRTHQLARKLLQLRWFSALSA